MRHALDGCGHSQRVQLLLLQRPRGVAKQVRCRVPDEVRTGLLQVAVYKCVAQRDELRDGALLHDEHLCKGGFPKVVVVVAEDGVVAVRGGERCGRHAGLIDGVKTRASE